MESTPEVAQEPVQPNLVSLLSNFSGGPTAEKVEEWKQQFGEIFCSGFSETELYVFRPLSWKEHRDVNKTLALPLQEGQEPRTEFDLQEMVVEKCLLWTSVPEFERKGGTVPSLFEMIMLNSNFVNPQMMAQFTVKL